MEVVERKVRQTQVIILVFIVLIAIFLRFYRLTQIPPGLDWDEVNSIYNGYSIARTGKDEFNVSFPILFRAFESYVPPVLIYLDAFSSLVFGLNEFAARLPIALLGVTSVVGIYLLISRTSGNGKLALLSALLLALSPWHITYSRVGTFASLPLIFIIFGTYFFLKGLTKSIYLIFTAGCFVVAILSYYSAYVFVPLYLIALVVVYRKHLFFIRTVALIVVVTGAAILLFQMPGGQTRFQGVSTLSDPDMIKRESTLAAQEWGGNVLHNRRLVYAQQLLEGYFTHFQYAFLFGKADAVRRFVVPGPGFGLLYWWELPVLLVGVYQLLRWRRKGWHTVLLWVLLAPVPASPALPQPASTRSILLVPAFSAVVASGFLYITRRSTKLVRFGIVLLLCVNMTLFIHQYFDHFASEKGDEWFSAYKPLFHFLNGGENGERSVLFFTTPPDYLDQVHIFTAFYNRIDPAVYQASGGTQLGRFGTTGEFSIGRFTFIPTDCTVCVEGRILGMNDLVVIARDLPLEPVTTFQNGNGRPVLYVYRAENISLDDIIDKSVQ